MSHSDDDDCFPPVPPPSMEGSRPTSLDTEFLCLSRPASFTEPADSESSRRHSFLGKMELEKNKSICELRLDETSSVDTRAMGDMNKESIRQAYEDVLADTTPTEWAVFKYAGKTLTSNATGISFDDFRSQFKTDEVAFGYIRVKAGDEISQRLKFLLISWVGPDASVMKRGKISTHKTGLKKIITHVALDLQLESLDEFDMAVFRENLEKCGGSIYGTGEIKN